MQQRSLPYCFTFGISAKVDESIIKYKMVLIWESVDNYDLSNGSILETNRECIPDTNLDDEAGLLQVSMISLRS